MSEDVSSTFKIAVVVLFAAALLASTIQVMKHSFVLMNLYEQKYHDASENSLNNQLKEAALSKKGLSGPDIYRALYTSSDAIASLYINNSDGNVGRIDLMSPQPGTGSVSYDEFSKIERFLGTQGQHTFYIVTYEESSSIPGYVDITLTRNADESGEYKVDISDLPH